MGGSEGSNVSNETFTSGPKDSKISVAADTKNLKFYFHTQHNRKVRMVDLKKIDFSQNKGAIKHVPLDKRKSQEIEDVTPK